MSKRWITIYHAPIYQIAGIQAQLEEAGIQTFVPDSHLKVWDPFITGSGTALDANLQVPEPDQVPAEQILKTYLANLAENRDRDLSEGREQDENSIWQSTEMRDLYFLGRRARWAAFLGLIPFGIYWGYRYFSRTKSLTEKPPYHGWTWFAMVWSGVAGLGTTILSWILFWSS